jgi:hypothetical protein
LRDRLEFETLSIAHSSARTIVARKTLSAYFAEALLQCPNISVTPMVVLDERGRAVFSNSAFQAFAAKELVTTKAHAAPPAPRIYNVTRSVPPPDVSILRWGARRRCRPGSPQSGSTMNRICLHERALLHDLSNAANGIQMLINLLTEEPSGEERSEYVKLLHTSMDQLLSEIDHKRAWLNNSGLTASACDVQDVLAELLRDYWGRARRKNC